TDPTSNCAVAQECNDPLIFNHPPPTKIYTLSLHDALPIYSNGGLFTYGDSVLGQIYPTSLRTANYGNSDYDIRHLFNGECHSLRSEEHTSELQSPCNLVCRLLLEKKKNSRPT